MSKHIFKQTLNGIEHQIQIGWDKPQRQFYGTILAASEDDTPDGKTYYDDIVWMNIYPPVVYSLEGIIQEITRQGFTIPNQLFENVCEDFYNNTVNRFKYYETDTPKQQEHAPQPPSF
ncbi:hypothetical protein [Agarilytica rhodophyticola]|uniref:hypothetical protein n=1 Tax=Agarilytica rhodophyticola TaxID=1737490 RepID=UPI000B342164|nr:hypothetical protein [Agarilytica rhodophyticola]